MKKAIITLALTAFITVSILAYVKPSNSNIIAFKNNADKAKSELYVSMEDSLQQFNKESETKIGKYEASISEFKSRIINEKRNNSSRTAKKLAEFTK